MLLVALESFGHDLRAVVDGEDDVSHTGGSKRFDLVNDHGSVAELDEGFGEGEGKRAQAGAKAADKNQSCACVSMEARTEKSN